jgi:hypothetical protein
MSGSNVVVVVVVVVVIEHGTYTALHVLHMTPDSMYFLFTKFSKVSYRFSSSIF